MSVLPNLIFRSNTIQIKIPAKLFCEYQQADSEVYVEWQKNQSSQFHITEEQSQKTDTIWRQDL